MIIAPLHDLDLVEFNHCHNPGGPTGGQFCSTGAEGRGGSRAERRRGIKRPVPIKVDDIGLAVELILQGKVVELKDVSTVHTVLSKLAAMALDAKAKNEKAPKYDLCNVSVPGTNLFCGSKLRTKKYPNGVPRIKMPQLTGEAVPGSQADRLPKSAKGNVNGAAAFVAHLESLGIRTTPQTVAASRLRATQAELVGKKVAGMMAAAGYDPGKEPIFVSRDNYVLDGHHRWAAVIGRDASDGKLGDKSMRIIRVDAPISEILHRAKRWTKKFGIKPKPADDD